MAEIITKYYEALRCRDMDAIRSCLDHHAILVFGEIRLSGIDAIMDGYQEFLGSMIEYTPTVTRVFSCDQNAVVVEGTVSGRNAGDKGTFAVPFAAVFELRDEKIVAERDYFDPSKMMPTG